MLIGIDFDNTLVSYDILFHKVALEQGVIPADIPRNKVAVRDYLRLNNREDIWTEMQGYVYGARMQEANAYPGALEFFSWARTSGLSLAIVSHKTAHPFMGPKYDLHQAAFQWIETHLKGEAGALLNSEQVFFELTREAKWDRISKLGCSIFIDDLPEILLAPSFPQSVFRILFDPDENHRNQIELLRLSSWHGIKRYFERKCHWIH